MRDVSGKFKVLGQPEYINSIDEIDTGIIKKELKDFVDADIAGALKNRSEGVWFPNVLGVGTDLFLKKVDNVSAGESYFLCKKLAKQSDTDTYYNMWTFTYKAKCIGDSGSIQNIYSCISVPNIVKYPDGTVKWGKTSPDEYDFIAKGSSESMEYSISAYITSYSNDYNITKIAQDAQPTEKGEN